MNSKWGKVLLTIILLSFIFLPIGIVNAADATFSIRPGTGTVKNNSRFINDILIDTKGNSVTLARVVILFNPKYIEVVKAEYNASLFCTYPSDDRTVDNTYGVIMFTGFCQSGTDALYVTEGEPDVFARITYKVKTEGVIDIDWRFSGKDEPFNTIILKEGSPPSPVLTAKPTAAKFTVSGYVVDPSDGDSTTPTTGFALSYTFIIAGIFLITLGAIYSRYGGDKIDSRRKTVVVYD